MVDTRDDLYNLARSEDWQTEDGKPGAGWFRGYYSSVTHSEE